MARADYHVFGLGSSADDLHYVGWTRRSLSEEQELIFADLARNGGRDIANWIAQAMECGKISIFEIESAPSTEDACNAAVSLCQYFNSLGLDVMAATAEVVPVPIAPCDQPGSHEQGAGRGSRHAEGSRVPA